MYFQPACLFSLFVLFRGSCGFGRSISRDDQGKLNIHSRSDDSEGDLPFVIDDLCLSYTLGLAKPRDITRFKENALSDTIALSADYFNKSRLLSDDVATAQYIKAVGINVLQARETCLPAKVARFFIVAVATLLDDKFDNVKTLVLPILDYLVPELPVKAPQIKRDLARKLGIRMMKTFIEPLVKKLCPEELLKNLGKVFKRELQQSNEDTLPDTFAAGMADALRMLDLDLQGAICPTLQTVATTFEEVLPEIPDIMQHEVAAIVVRFRTSLHDKDIAIPNAAAVGALFNSINIITRDEMQYAVAEMGTGKPADIRSTLASYWDITLPADLSGEHPEVVTKMEKVMKDMVGETGALRDLYDTLEPED